MCVRKGGVRIHIIDRKNREARDSREKERKREKEEEFLLRFDERKNSDSWIQPNACLDKTTPPPPKKKNI